MNTLLSKGSQGAEVKVLQTMLNLLPSGLGRLIIDGLFGPLTEERVREFQRYVQILVDGIVGGQTMDEIAKRLRAYQHQRDLERVAAYREAIVRQAESLYRDYGPLIHAKKKGPKAPSGWPPYYRTGADYLWMIIHDAAPSYTEQLKRYYSLEDKKTHNAKPKNWRINESDELAPCPHWCGIFALYCHKQAGLGVGNWVQGLSIDSVSGFSETKTPTKGDVGFADKKGKYDKHHMLIVDVMLKGTDEWYVTIEGNSGTDSTIKHYPEGKPRSDFDSFWTAF